MMSPAGRVTSSTSPALNCAASASRPGHSKPSRISSALSWSVLRICSPRPRCHHTGRCWPAPRRRQQRHRRANRRVLSSPTSRVMRSMRMPLPCSSLTISSMRKAGPEIGHAVASSICSATMCEWCTKLTGRAGPARRARRIGGVAVAHHQACTRWLTISHRASKSRRRHPPARGRSAPLAHRQLLRRHRRSNASRRSVVVKMPRRSPCSSRSRTSACVRRAPTVRGTRSRGRRRRPRNTACAGRRRGCAPSPA